MLGAPVRTLVVFFLNRFRLRGGLLYKTYFAFAAGFLKAFGVAEVLSLLARRFGFVR